jgi:ribosomal protein S6
MVIFPDRLNEDEIDEATKGVRAEIEKHGGAIVSNIRLGRRPFARVMQKESYGHYAVIVFDIDGGQIPALHARFKLNDQVMRVQIVRAAEVPAAAAE